jgi:hypothetical protein
MRCSVLQDKEASLPGPLFWQPVDMESSWMNAYCSRASGWCLLTAPCHSLGEKVCGRDGKPFTWLIITSGVSWRSWSIPFADAASLTSCWGMHNLSRYGINLWFGSGVLSSVRLGVRKYPYLFLLDKRYKVPYCCVVPPILGSQTSSYHFSEFSFIAPWIIFRIYNCILLEEVISKSIPSCLYQKFN